MPLSVNTNLASLNTQTAIAKSEGTLNSALQRLSSGMRINSAKDDAAGVGITSRMQSTIRGLNVAVRNANDGISLVQVAESALIESSNLLQRIRELSVQSANSSNSSGDRDSLDTEAQQLIAEMDRLAMQTEFNGSKILSTNGGYSASFQVGAQSGQVMSVSVAASRTSDMGVSSNYAAILNENDATFAARLRVQYAGALSSSTLNGASLNDVPANSAAAAKLTSIAQSQANVGAFLYGNSLVGAANTANAAGGTADGDIVVNGVQILATAGGTVAQVVAAINAKAGETGVTADATAGGTLVLFNRTGGAVTLQVNSANAATATGFSNGSQTVQAAGTNGAIVMTYDVGQTSLAVNAAATAGALEGSTADATLTFQSTAITSLDISTQAGANLAILATTRAVDKVNTTRSTLGAFQNRLESAISSMRSAIENTSAARSRIEDADFAAETAALTKSQVLHQAGVAILSQANQLPQQVLSLVRQ